MALALLAVGVFAFTKHMAAREQHMEARVAQIRYEQGNQLLGSGKIEEAIQSFRSATADARENKQYALALADALARGNHSAEAEQLLLRLRESDPENSEINIYLARLALKRGEMRGAVHYYQNALYGRWIGDQVDERRRRIRMELIRVLLEHQERSLAISELLILESELPVTSSFRVETAEAFVEAGDLQHAFKDYVEAVRLDSHNLKALKGAAETSFEVGDYTKAIHYSRAFLELDPQDRDSRHRLSLAELILAEDPLSPHLATNEQQRRLLLDFRRSLRRLTNCLGQTTDAEQKTELQALQAEALTMEPQLGGKHAPGSVQPLSALALIVAMQKKASTACGQGDLADEALLLIGRKHDGERP